MTNFYNIVGSLLERAEADKQIFKRFPNIIWEDIKKLVLAKIPDSERKNNNNKTRRFRFCLYENIFLTPLEPAFGTAKQEKQ